MALFPIPIRSTPRWRPAAIFKNSNGDVSAMDYLFVSRVMFSGSTYRVLLLPVELNPTGGVGHLGKFREQLCGNMSNNNARGVIRLATI